MFIAIHSSRHLKLLLSGGQQACSDAAVALEWLGIAPLGGGIGRSSNECINGRFKERNTQLPRCLKGTSWSTANKSSSCSTAGVIALPAVHKLHFRPSTPGSPSLIILSPRTAWQTDLALFSSIEEPPASPPEHRLLRHLAGKPKKAYVSSHACRSKTLPLHRNNACHACVEPESAEAMPRRST